MRMRSALGMPYPHPHTVIISGTERPVYRLDPVVPARGAAVLGFDSAELQIHIIVDHHYPVFGDTVVRTYRSNRIAGIIHKSQRFRKEKLPGRAVQRHHPFAKQCKAFMVAE